MQSGERRSGARAGANGFVWKEAADRCGLGLAVGRQWDGVLVTQVLALARFP